MAAILSRPECILTGRNVFFQLTRNTLDKYGYIEKSVMWQNNQIDTPALVIITDFVRKCT